MYATSERYGGQRPYVTAPIVIKMSDAAPVEAGMIVEIDDMTIVMKSLLTGWRFDYLAFVETKTEDDIDKMPANSWTWPVRV